MPDPRNALKSDEGFTLAEMLVALVLVGLAASGLALAAHQVTQAEARVEGARHDTQDLARLSGLLGDSLRSAGPFLAGAAAPARLDGDSRTFSFSCAGDAPCRLELQRAARWTVAIFHGPETARTVRLAGLGAPALRYISALDGRLTDRWPAGDRVDRLSAVVLADGEAPVAVYRIAIEQSARCVFDARLRGCAAEGTP